MAISYRPTTELHAKLRVEAERTGSSIQQIIDTAVTEHFTRTTRRSAADIARDFKSRHEATYTALETR